MCYHCGHFICCGTCYGNFLPVHLSDYKKDGACVNCFCDSCYSTFNKKDDIEHKKLDKVFSLESLLAHEPTGRHSLYARYLLCDLRLNQSVGTLSEIKAARKELLKLALDENHGPSLFKLACLHDDGANRYNDGPIHMANHKHFKTDPDRHRKYLKASAKQGFTKAVMEVGTCYKNGSSGFVKDWKLAHDYLEQAATHGDPKAMVNISEILLRGGNGTKENPAKGFKYIKKAATKYDNANAMCVLFQFSRQPEFQSWINLEEGIQWLIKSDELGFPPAESFLVQMKRRG
jgi:TPR repeat protein